MADISFGPIITGIFAVLLIWVGHLYSRVSLYKSRYDLWKALAEKAIRERDKLQAAIDTCSGSCQKGEGQTDD